MTPTPFADRSETDIVTTRIELHWAAQVAAAAGVTRGEPAADFAHHALTWDGPTGSLAGPRIDAEPGYRTALRIADRSILLLVEGAEPEALPLGGLTPDEAVAGLDARIAARTSGGGEPLGRPSTHEMPAPRHAPDGRFGHDANPLWPDFAGLYAQVAAELAAVHAREPNAGPVRLWPHHFDTATLIAIDPSESGEDARSVGVGLSPGDGGHPLPYWYVTPWPYPSAVGLPELAGGGRWHTEGWVGAVLSAVGATPADVTAFLPSAIDASKALLDPR